MSLRERIEKRQQALSEVSRLTDEIGRTICDALRPVITDIEHTVSWAEAGITLCLWSNSRDVFRANESWYSIDWILVDMLEERGIPLKVDAPYGVYVTPEEEAQVRDILEKLLA